MRNYLCLSVLAIDEVMSPIIGIPLENIGEKDLQALIDTGYHEDKFIDYKKELPAFALQKTNVPDKDKKEFLNDISSFANASGGDIIYGIPEKNGVPINLSGVSISKSDFDQVKLKLENIIRSHIQPRIQGVSIQSIDLRNERLAIIIRIPRSPFSPHMVTLELKNNERFFSRHSGGKYSLDVSEIRSAFLLSETIAKRIKDFHVDRLSKIVSRELPIPLTNGPKIIFHIIPFTAFDIMKKIDLSFFERKMKMDLLTPGYDPRPNWRYNFDGILVAGKDRAYVQAFRNGIIEYVDSGFTRCNQIEPDSIVIEGKRFDHLVYSALEKYVAAQRLIGIEPPLFVILSLQGVADCYIGTESKPNPYGSDKKIDRDLLIIPEGLIDNFEYNPDEIMKPILDAVWNAAGYDKSQSFDNNGKWINK